MKPELFGLLPDMALFVAVANAMSFSRAARALAMPVSTVSRRMADLEKRIGVPLLVRTTRQVVLTDAGAAYVARCRTIVEAAEAAHAELRGHAETPRGRLRVSATADFALTYLTPVFVEYAQRFPDVSFELDLTPRPVDLVAESVDVAIRMGNLPDSPLVARRLGAPARGLYAAPTYLARAGKPKRPAELSAHACIRLLVAQDVEQTWTLLRGSTLREVPVAGRFVANNVRFLRELATCGLGIVALDIALAQPEIDRGRLVRILPEWSPPAVPVHALTAGRLWPRKTTLLLDTLSQHLTGHRNQISASGLRPDGVVGNPSSHERT